MKKQNLILTPTANRYNAGWRLWTKDYQTVGPDFGSREEATYWALCNGYKLG